MGKGEMMEQFKIDVSKGVDCRLGGTQMEQFQTRPHDYTSCHPDIAAALKRGEEIYCRTWLDKYPEDVYNYWVYSFNEARRYVSDVFIGDSALPVPAEAKD